MKAQLPLIQKLTQGIISSYEFEQRLIKEDNTHVWVRNVVYTIKEPESRNVRFGVMSMTNISDRKASEQSFINLTKTLAHDLITPLGHIESYAALIQEKGYMSEKGNCFLDIISQSATHARNIVMDVLENATLDKENIEKYKEITDINHLLYTYLSSFTLQAKQQNVTLEYKLMNNPVYINISKTHIRRVIANLINNAFKFTPENGRIDVSSEVKNNRYILHIEDTGIGIPEKLLEELFKPFSKAQRKGLKGERSTGLGIYIVKQIIELHGGLINLESEEGNGTCVHIELPIV
jgi:signal transduction histidine kinase